MTNSQRKIENKKLKILIIKIVNLSKFTTHKNEFKTFDPNKSSKPNKINKQ
jgi:hypothetical protein